MIANALFIESVLESRRGDATATLRAAGATASLGQQHGMALYVAAGEFMGNWARGRLYDAGPVVSALRQALTANLEAGIKFGAPLFHGLLAEIEFRAHEADRALALIEKGLDIAEETGEHFTDAYLHRLRGDVLLQRDPTNPAPAEDALRTAITIAKQQGARTFELLAALSLAKLHQSTGRPADAHAVLAPALEGFSPTPEMPEIAEAQALLAALA